MFPSLSMHSKFKKILICRVADPHCFNADPDLDPAFYLFADPDADLDPDPVLDPGF